MKRLLSAIVVAALVFSSFALNAKDDDREHTLKIYNWSDYIDEDLLDEFEEWYEEQTGEPVHIVYQLFDINEVMLAKIERGHADYDLVCPSDYIIERMINMDLVLPIDKDFGDTPNYLGNVSPYMNTLFSKMATGDKDARDYAVGYMWGTTGFLFNKKFVKEEDLKSWGALMNPAFSGHILMKDGFRDVYSPMLIYLNADKIASGEVDMEQLMFDTSDESIAQVENFLNGVKPNLLGWEADFGKELMTQEKAWLNLTWSGDAKWAIEEAKEVGVDLEYVVPEEGSNVWFDGWLIPKYAQNIKAARYFINFMCRSDVAIRNMEEIGYVSAVGTDEILEYMKDFAQEEGAVDTLDASYFFGDAAKAVVIDHVFYADKSVIDRCALMHDSGERTQELLEMWSRVKGNNMNLTTVIILVVAVIAILAAVLAKAKKNARHKKSAKKSHR